MKEKYEDIACEVVVFEKADVITTSNVYEANDVLPNGKTPY